ncbi:hypothetical protein VNO78_15665 [Psophocarpus tetragonolobus]|uniref:Uncharacterized protein n=1 Tax=Psophocarpus tetragonolobus TaxID=3891 RepID=A0AAN9SJ70_PSOTE
MEEKHKLERVIERTTELLRSLEYENWQPYSSPIVAEELRRWNEKAYEPKVVSIGPRFKGRRELLAMEKTKLWYMRSLLKSQLHTSELKTTLKSCMDTVLSSDDKVRACYGEEIKLDRYELARIMLFDTCFLLELLISGPTSDVDLPMKDVLSDLMLVENQIPYFILVQLHESIFQWECLMDTAEFIESRVWSLFYPVGLTSRSKTLVRGGHILELAHRYVLWMNRHLSLQPDHSTVLLDINNQEKHFKLKRCVTKFQGFGVIVTPSQDNSLVPISGSSKFLFKFSDGVLQIPTLDITQTTEPMWRSYIAWECHKKKQQKKSGNVFQGDIFTFLALLFNDLICCASDVHLLKNKGIIVDHLGMSNHDLVDFFRSITNGIDPRFVHSSYNDMIDALNTYSSTHCVVRFPVILWHSFGQFWELLLKFLSRGYNFAAALITLLTVIQTFYAVISYHRSN